MSNDEPPYIPISCADHSAWELAIMRQQHFRICWRDTDRLEHLEHLLPVDLQTCNGAEYLIARDQQGSLLQIRLDQILHNQPL